MKPTQAHQTLLAWERHTLTPADLGLPGWVPFSALNRCSGVLAMGLLAVLPFPLWPAGLVFARLAALDLTAYVLPDIYTIPLLATGLAHALTTQAWPQVAVGLLFFSLSPVTCHLSPRMGVGGGDLKLLAAMLAWLPPHVAGFAVALGCLAWLPLAFWRPKTPQPFGIPLLLGWTVILLFPHLQEWLLRPMLGG